VFITIITIVKNDKSGFLKTLNSVSNQNFSDYEWVVIDGCSVDGTAELACSIDFPRFKVISEPDAGIFDAMNKALFISEGDFVVFLNAGDIFSDRDTLKKVYYALLGNNADFLYGDSSEYFSGRLMYKKARGYMKLKAGMFACHQSMYYRRQVANDLKFNTSFKVSGDYDFTARFLQITNRIVYVPDSLCVFDRGGVSNLNKKVGRFENYCIQRDVLKVRYYHRKFYQLRAYIASLVSIVLPLLYKNIRYVE
jgi:glycosyltransferase involved in cell wall biosynthesis